ncbi:MAG: SufE Fe/S-cluster-related protein [Chlorobi bacterium OLB5]|nr:MAG: SufE Fe/S-cluster-related protein [Chlorobi bacterium OLB5]
MNKTIHETEEEIIDEFSFFESWQDKYEYIIELGKKLKDFPEDKRTEDNKVKGCQSSVWVVTRDEDGKIYFKADSDSTIVKGLIALLIRVLNGRTPEEILSSELGFIDKTGLKQHLAQTRANGLAAMIKQMKMYALAYKTKYESSK